MSVEKQFATGTLLLVAGALLMAYTVYALEGLPYVYTPVLAWLVLVEYAVGRAWWDDAQDLYATRRTGG